MTTTQFELPAEQTHADERINRILRVLCVQPWLRRCQLAKLVGLSESYLQHLFTREVGVSISVYSLKLRLEWALQLLTTSDLSVKEIAHQVGIPNPSNFNHQFKKRFHVSPKTARKAAVTGRKAVLTNTNALQT